MISGCCLGSCSNLVNMIVGDTGVEKCLGLNKSGEIGSRVGR